MNAQEEYMEKIRQREIGRGPGRKWGLLICVVTAVLTLWLVNWAFAEDFDLLPNGMIIMDTPCIVPLSPMPGEYEGDVYLRGCIDCSDGDWGFPSYPNPPPSRAERERSERIEALGKKIDRILDAVD